MSPSRIIKARIELPCSIRFQAAALGSTRGITEELSRESLVVVAFSPVLEDRLRKSAHISVAIDLPHSGEFRPRLLECAATVSGVRSIDTGLRISAAVNRMSIKVRDTDHTAPGDSDAAVYGVQSIPVIAGSRNVHRVVHPNRLTAKPQGESMSFLKNLFVEEDGQDMVEYGIVIALVVIAAAAAMTAFSGQISTAFAALGTSVTTSIQ
jgi:pilus assembly protein Flp/PilA